MTTNESQKFRARRQVRWAIDAGKLVRPTACPKCGDDRLCADGRSRIHAHHHRGYDHPLDVEWLCAACHVLEDPRVSGEAHGRAVLTEAQVLEIRSSNEATKHLAERFDVAMVTIQQIRKGRSWRKAGGEIGKRSKATHCRNGHSYELDGVLISMGRRWCRMCALARAKKRYYRLKAQHVLGER